MNSQTLPDGLRITPKEDKVFTRVFTAERSTTNACGLELVLSA